ncbi:MAG: hypothetical protein KKG75_04120 [Nanoarchaeota archaeon]|nr:hypothetical protein [Nanoarchaeota archaeon]
MSRTYKAVTRKERREGTRGCRSCYRPGLPSGYSSISAIGFAQFLQDRLGDEKDVWDGHIEELLERYEGQGIFYFEEGETLRYQKRNNTETQTVPKIDWHTERRWRNGRKSRNKIITRVAEDLRERAEAVNVSIDNALANGRNPFRRSRFEHCRYGWGN